MASWKWREVRKALLAKGFSEDARTDHQYYRLYVGGKATSIRTKISFGNKGELNSNSPLMSKIQRQLDLRKRDVEDLLNCPLSEEDYVGILRAKGALGD